MKIKILTTSIQELISGGTIYNNRLKAFLNEYSEVSLEQIEQIETYNFEKNYFYIIDGILISEEIEIEKIKDFSIHFLIHLWPSILENNDTTKKKLEEIETIICKNFKLILTGENSKKHILTTLQTTFNGLIISPGIDTNWIQKNSFKPLPKKMIYLSNFIEGKGHFRLLEALSLLKVNDVIVDCYGEILSENYFNSFLSKKPSFVNFKGKIAHHEVNKILINYDLFLHFSDYESFGMGILEAIATHLPILITPVGNFKNYAKNDVKGVLNTFEREEIINYLNEICIDEKKYKNLINSISNYKYSTWNENFKPILELFLTR